MRKWEPEEVKKITYGLLGGIAVGLIAGILLKNIGLFLPLGGIAGMCITINLKNKGGR